MEDKNYKIETYNMNMEYRNFFVEIRFKPCISYLDSKMYLFLAIISLILFFYSIFEIKFVIVDIKDFLGLTSRLTLAYWIGYILIVFCSIHIYLNKEYKNKIIYIITLMILGLFLFGVPIFAEENARFPWSYYPAGEVKTTLKTEYIDSISTYPLISYRSWPATHLISASILYLTNIKIEDLLKYMPLFWVFSIILITFSIGKRLKLSDNQSFLASFLVLSSFWTFHYYYGPQSFAYILYLLLFMFIVTFSKIRQNIDTVLISFTFITIVITHMLSSIAVLFSFVLSSSFIQSLYERRIRLIILFLIIFIAWYAYLAPVMFKLGVIEIIKQMNSIEFFSFAKTLKYSSDTLLTRQITHYSRLFYLGIYAISMIISVAFYLTGRIKGDNKKLTKILYYWLVSILTLLVLRYGVAEIDDRVYILSLVPMVLILILSFNQKIHVILALMLLIPHVPAHYGNESFDLALTTELRGSEFLAFKVANPNESYLYYYTPYVNYFYPEKVDFPHNYFVPTYKPNISIFNDITYIVDSKQTYNQHIYDFGFSPIHDFIANSEKRKLNLIYNNYEYKIFKIR